MKYNSEPMNTIEVQTSDGKHVAVQPIFKFDVIGLGMNCDNQVWVVECDGSHRFVATDLGTPYFESSDFIRERLTEYKLVLSDAQKALNLLELTIAESKRTVTQRML